MICVVISEKGGTERRELFDQDELTIGRVKGNDVLLPKGNVSKRHARIAFRDGRYIVTDLKSTNGTYVNHRRITHATLIREVDRIYIGDFILCVDEGAATRAAPANETATSRPSGAPDVGRAQRSSANGQHEPRTLAPSAPSEGTLSEGPSSPELHDSGIDLVFPGPPRVPDGVAPTPRQRTTPIDSQETAASSDAGTGKMLRAGAEAQSPQMRLAGTRQAEHARLLGEVVRAVENEVSATALDVLPRPSDDTAHRVALAIDAWIVRAEAAGSLNETLDIDLLRLTARRELLELGALGMLLDDDRVTRVRIVGRAAHVQRHGSPQAAHDGPGFGTTTGLARAVRRVCAAANEPVLAGEHTVERDLGAGTHLFAVLPPVAPDGPLVIVRRMRAVDTTINSLVRSGAISRSMATFLTHCVRAKSNLLVTGAPDSGADELLEALAAATAEDAHVVHLQTRREACAHGSPMVLGSSEEEKSARVRTAALLSPDFLFVAPLSGRPLGSLLDAIADGTNGVVLASAASTLRQAVDRLGAELGAVRDLPVAAAREWLASSFDIGVEVSRLEDGRPRVVRIAELRAGGQGGASRDVFTFVFHRMAHGGAVEGSFHASGTVPRVVDELAARGLPLDTSIFRRHPSA